MAFDYLTEQERRLAIAHDVLVDITHELQDGWDEVAMQILDGKRKVQPKEKFYSDVPVQPKYETGIPNYEQ